jgi:uncharacterized membrane protein YbhN (UPF0104 family)
MSRARKSSTDTWAPERLTLLVLLAAALSTGALVGVAWVAGFHKVLTGLVHPHWLWLGIAVVGEVVAYVGYTVAYREIARAENGAELEVPRAASLVATGFGAFVHGGGFALDRAALERSGLSKTEARCRVLGLGVLEYAVLAPAALVAAALVFVQHQSISSSLTLPWIIGVPVGAAIALTALHFREKIAEWRWVGKPLDNWLHSLKLVLGLLVVPRRHGLAFAGTLAYWIGDIFCLWSTLHAFSAHPPPVAQLVVGYASGYALTRRALPLGGAGIVETLLPFTLSWLAIALAPALLAVFAYRVINLWLPIIPALAGIPTIRRLEHTTPRTRKRRTRVSRA